MITAVLSSSKLDDCKPDDSVPTIYIRNILLAPGFILPRCGLRFWEISDQRDFVTWSRIKMRHYFSRDGAPEQ